MTCLTKSLKIKTKYSFSDTNQEISQQKRVRAQLKICSNSSSNNNSNSNNGNNNYNSQLLNKNIALCLLTQMMLSNKCSRTQVTAAINLIQTITQAQFRILM